MNVPLKAVTGSKKLDGNLEATMREIGREARKAARAMALAPTKQKNRALSAMANAIRGSAAAILAANAEDRAAAKVRRRDARLPRPAGTRWGAGRSHGGRARDDPQAQGSGRDRARIVAPAERHAYRARPRTARRRRRDLREPAQCDRGCRRALPQGRQRHGAARRFRELPLVPGDPCRDGRGTDRGWAAGSGHHAGADPGSRRGRPDAHWPRRHHRRDRATRRQEPGRPACRPKPGSRSSPTSKASVMCTSTPRPSSPWPSRSC